MAEPTPPNDGGSSPNRGKGPSIESWKSPLAPPKGIEVARQILPDAYPHPKDPEAPLIPVRESALSDSQQANIREDEKKELENSTKQMQEGQPTPIESAAAGLSDLKLNSEQIEFLLTHGDTVETIRAAADSYGSEFLEAVNDRIEAKRQKEAEAEENSRAEEPEQPSATPVTGEILPPGSKIPEGVRNLRDWVGRLGRREQSQPSQPDQALPDLSDLDLTPEEVELFLANDYTVEDLQGVQAELDPQEFRQEIDLLLQQMRGEQPEDEAVDHSERSAEQAGGNDDEYDGDEGSDEDGPRGPEGPRNPEYEISPERGRAIVKEIIRLEANPEISYTERYKLKVTDSLLNREYLESHRRIYNERTGTYLDQLYADLKNYSRGLRKIRNDRDVKDPWDQEHVYAEMAENMARLAKEKEAAIHRELGPRPDVLPEKSVTQLWEEYLKPTADTDLEAVEADLATYFFEGRGLGILQIGEAIFKVTYNRFTTGKISREQAEVDMIENVEKAKKFVDGFFMTQRTKPEVDHMKLAGLAEAYANRTFHQFAQFLGGEEPSAREGEFSFKEGTDLTDEDKETYWRPGHYPKMYEVLARNEQQFRKAADSFLQMITKGSVGKSPDDLYQHFENFKDALGQIGSQQEQAGVVESEFMENLRVEMEAHGFIFGADYSAETYNPKSFNQFMMAMSLHEGPQRWVRLARSGNGQVGAFLWKFDNDRRVTLLHNTGGSRGQLLSDTITQHYLHNEIKNILIEEGMGVVLKDYDPRDLKSIANDPDSVKVLNDPVAEEERIKYFKANQERIGIHQTKKDFKGLYENFDTGDTHIANYLRYKDLDESELKKLSIKLRRSVQIGHVQSLLVGKEGRSRGELSHAIEAWVREDGLTPRERDQRIREKRIWEEAYDQTKANFDVAFQMVGASGEKVRRGGGVFFIDRKTENNKKFVDNMPVYLAEKWVQYAVTRCKIQFTNASAVDRAAAVDRAMVHAIQQLLQKGFEAKLEVPKIVFDALGNVTGTHGTEIIDFDTAVKSLYSRWTNHTYWSYQPENRHMLTDPDVVAAAKRIRAGLSRPEDEDNLASFLLLVDPTLKRVARLEDTQVRDGESAQQQEIMLFDAAVEASNQGHWTIVRELNAKFMPEDGNPFKMRTGYNLEDYGGISRFIIRMRQFIASNPKRFARRYATEIANLPLNVSSMPDQFGQEGVLGAIEMMADPIGAMADQREVSQFAITKWVEQMRIGNMIFEALVGHMDPQSSFSIEGLFEKPTNNSDKLSQVWDKLKTYGTKQDEVENEFFYAVMESFDRLWIVLKLVRTMESDTRNAQGALDLEKTDIFLADGKVNPAIAVDRNTGSSRHTERVFFDKYIDWLLSPDEGRGQKTYTSEVKVYNFLREKYFYVDAAGVKHEDGRTWADWLFEKMAR